MIINSYLSPLYRFFLRRSTGVADVPKQDRHLALNLLLEFSVQKGTLREMLETVMLLFRIWNRERSPLQAQGEDNRDSTDAVAAGNGECGGTDAPLIGFLRRVEAIDPSVKKVCRISQFIPTTLFI